MVSGDTEDGVRTNWEDVYVSLPAAKDGKARRGFWLEKGQKVKMEGTRRARPHL